MDPFRRVAIEPFNVQWDFGKFPVEQSDPPVEESCVQASAITTTILGTEGGGAADHPSKLSQCHGSWKWRSCKDDDDVVVGGQLAVGTVFSRRLIATHGDSPLSHTWDDVEIFAKYRVDDKNKLDNIFLTLCDSGANSFPGTDDWGNCVNNVWRVVGLRKDDSWSGWDDPENLRAVLSFQGTTNAANVGKVTVDVEWFAILLSDEES
jgi:hypothetical protein